MTLDSVRPTQSAVIWIIHRNAGSKCFFFNFCQNVCYYSLYIHISFIFHKVV